MEITSPRASSPPWRRTTGTRNYNEQTNANTKELHTAKARRDNVDEDPTKEVG